MSSGDKGYEKLQEIFLSALELESLGDRETYLVKACGDDVSLRQEIDALLEEYEAENLESPLKEEERPAKDSSAFVPGTVLAGHYRIVALLGRGGMGEVYRADDLQLGESVALKFLPPRLTHDPVALDRLRKEVRTARGITHPNVCRIHDMGEAEGQAFISMEYVDGEDLSVALKRMGRPSEEKAIEITHQICLGLAAVHDAGVIHRDLKPANIMIDGRGNVRLMDFGVAGAQKDLAVQRRVAGTPRYMAPELAKSGKATVSSDIYALGLVLYEVFTGKRADIGEPFPGKEPSTTPSTPSSIVTGIDPLVERAIMRCLEVDADERPASVYALLNALPGGDPLAAAVAAGQTPSPEMVAAAGGEGMLGRRIALFCLAWVPIGLGLVFWLAQEAWWLNQDKHQYEHPEVLTSKARELLKQWGYELSSVHATGYLYKGKAPDLHFWYRQRPNNSGFFVNGYYNRLTTTERSAARVTPINPAYRFPGEVYVRLDLSGRLHEFRATPIEDWGPKTPEAPPDWDEWFPISATGMKLSALTSIDEMFPPGMDFQHLQAWKGYDEARSEPFFVQVASFRGKPVSYLREDASLFKWAASDRGMAFGRSPVVSFTDGVFLALVAIGSFLAWRNIRSGRSDRRGAWRFALSFFLVGVMSWALLTSSYNTGHFVIGGAQWLHEAALIWLFYLAMEPYVRRLWPQTLIAWSRLVGGRGREPLVGRALLLGACSGILAALLALLYRMLPVWIGGESDALLALVSPLTLEGPMASTGYFLRVILGAIHAGFWWLFVLLCLYRGFSFLLRKPALVWVALFASVSVLLFYLEGLAGPAGWISAGIHALLGMWIITRLGVLSFCIHMIAIRLLTFTPITTDFSVWYASSGVIAALIMAAFALFGFYYSQGGRSLLGDPLDK